MSKSQQNPVSIKRELITPAKAQAWLDAQGKNRNLSQAVVERYANDMRLGLWREDTAEPIRLDDKDKLNDGQHRLSALILAEKSLNFYVARGISAAAAAVVDTGKPRSFADVLQLGGRDHARKIAAVAKLLYHYYNGTMLTSGRHVSTPLLKQLERKHKDAIEAAVEHIYHDSELRPQSVLATVYAVAYEKYPKITRDFFTAVNEMDSGPDGRISPVARLNQRLRQNAQGKAKVKGSGAKVQLRVPYVAALTIKAFNAYRLKETFPDPLEWRAQGKDEAFPTIL